MTAAARYDATLVARSVRVQTTQEYLVRQIASLVEISSSTIIHEKAPSLKNSTGQILFSDTPKVRYIEKSPQGLILQAAKNRFLGSLDTLKQKKPSLTRSLKAYYSTEQRAREKAPSLLGPKRQEWVRHQALREKEMREREATHERRRTLSEEEIIRQYLPPVIGVTRSKIVKLIIRSS